MVDYDYIDKSGFYYFFLSYCYNQNATVEIEYMVMNPGNEHLSFDLIPNKRTYLMFFIIWATVFFISIVWVIWRLCRSQSLTYLSLMIMTTYFMITVYCVLGYFYWLQMSDVGKAPPSFEILLLILEASILFWYLVIINMVASGYKIVHLLFQYRRFVKNAVIILFMLLTSLLMSYSNFFLTILMVAEIVILILLLKMDISYTIRSLQEMIQGLDINSPQDHDYVRGISFKIKYYKVFMLYIYLYWPMEIIAQSLRPFLALYHQWIFTLLHQILTLISLSFLFVTLHFSIKERPSELEDPFSKIPLPFDPERDPKITGEIIIIHSVGDKPGGVFSVGVECSYKHRGSVYKSQQVLTDRAKVYQIDDIEEEAKHDVWKITHNLNFWDSETSLVHNFKLKSSGVENSKIDEHKPIETGFWVTESDIEESKKHEGYRDINVGGFKNHFFPVSKICNDNIFNRQRETQNEPIWFKYGWNTQKLSRRSLPIPKVSIVNTCSEFSNQRRPPACLETSINISGSKSTIEIDKIELVFEDTI